jgi:hypothetical protein
VHREKSKILCDLGVLCGEKRFTADFSENPEEN